MQGAVKGLDGDVMGGLAGSTYIDSGYQMQRLIVSLYLASGKPIAWLIHYVYGWTESRKAEILFDYLLSRLKCESRP